MKQDMDEFARTATVFVVDDEPDVRDVMARFVEGRGCAVVECHSAENALSEMEKTRCDIMISDIRMRGIDGVELLKRVKEKWPGTEFVLVSGHATLKNAIEAMRCGAYDLLLKPVSMADLLSTVDRCLARLSYARENVELRKVVDSLTDLNARKEKFVAIANHELRTPTAIAAGIVAMLKRKAAALPPDVSELVHEADRSMARLKEVVKDIGELATARSLEHWVKPYPAKLSVLTGEVSGLGELSIRTRKLEFEVRNLVSGDREIVADITKAARAVGALLQNAVKFSPDGERIELEVDLSGGFVRFTVMDRGVGVAKGEEERIFDLFYTSGSELSHHTSDHEFGGGGLGVGLALARTVARAHGGDVTYAPREGGGSVFTLTIRAAS